ncbi:Uncharacterised protein [Capnocytophaga ochracea]|uniref:Uncharacterized protein n=1 Tax=Capnocytophaga ochracea TaxID=1018 RepID=A0A2X1ICX0_CAPOC|nr:Uncharacterised protein [Capnocytophaga ochracea]SPV25507.1 Uncharacterised protein [Capnocytophaga ochracea]
MTNKDLIEMLKHSNVDNYSDPLLKIIYLGMFLVKI